MGCWLRILGDSPSRTFEVLICIGRLYLALHTLGQAYSILNWIRTLHHGHLYESRLCLV